MAFHIPPLIKVNDDLHIDPRSDISIELIEANEYQPVRMHITYGRNFQVIDMGKSCKRTSSSDTILEELEAARDSHKLLVDTINRERALVWERTKSPEKTSPVKMMRD